MSEEKISLIRLSIFEDGEDTGGYSWLATYIPTVGQEISIDDMREIPSTRARFIIKKVLLVHSIVKDFYYDVAELHCKRIK